MVVPALKRFVVRDYPFSLKGLDLWKVVVIAIFECDFNSLEARLLGFPSRDEILQGCKYDW